MQPELIEIQVCSRNLPLDWILSESVREEMKQEMDNPDPHISCGNKAKIDHIAQLLGH